MKKELFSVSYSGSWGQARLGLTDFIGKAGQLGCDGVFLMAKRPYLSPLDAVWASPERIDGRWELRAAYGKSLAQMPDGALYVE